MTTDDINAHYMAQSPGLSTFAIGAIAPSETTPETPEQVDALDEI